jgi:polygalacturonase
MQNRIYNVSTEKTVLLQTKIVQKTIDNCNENGGGIVRFERGRYELSTVFLRSNVTIELAEGAEILGSLNFNDYCAHENLDYPLYQDASHSFFHTSLFVGINCEHVKIIGKGKIDMRSVWDEDNVRIMCHRGAKCIALKNCKNVEISGVGIYNVTDLAVYFAGCENVDIYGIKMRVHIDGISPDNSKNVRIHDCDVETGDDGIVFKSSYTDVWRELFPTWNLTNEK